MRMTWISSLIMLAIFVAPAFAVPVTDGLIVHLRADALMLNDTDPVTVWPDAALWDTVDGTVSQITLNDPEHSGVVTYGVPTFKTSAHNGLPTVHFTRPIDFSVPGNKQILVSEDWSWAQDEGLTVFIACTGGITGGGGTVQRVVQVGERGGTNGANFACDVNSTQSGVRFGNGSYLVSSPFNYGDWHISVRQMNQGQEYNDVLYIVDGVTQAGSGNTGRYINFRETGNVISVGSGYHADVNHAFAWLDWYDGDLAEVLVYNAQLTEAQIQEVTTFLNNKYGLRTAHTPSPANAAVNQGAISNDQVEVTFSWNTGLDQSQSAPNPDIVDHYFYLAANEPNFADVSPVVISAGSPVQASASHGPILLSMDKTYYWRVDEAVSQGPGDPNMIEGPAWSFETVKSVPIITRQPSNQIAFVNNAASLTIEINSLSPAAFTWYRSADNANDTPGDDTLKGQDQTLEFANVQITDEGYYYCTVVNDSGQENAAYSDVVTLGVKRNVGHWTLDQADYVAGQYLDSSNEAHHADPNVYPDPSQFVAGAGAATNEGLDLTVEPLSAARTGDWTATAFTSEVTISAWVKWAGPNDAWQGVVCHRGDTANNFLVEIRKDNGNLQFNAPYFDRLESDNLPLDQWTHVAVSAGAGGDTIYFDGVPVASRVPGTALRQNLVPTYLGAINSTAEGVLTSPFHGVLDDIRVYNYSMDHTEVVDLYYDVTGTSICVYPPAYDVAGGGPLGDEPDCVVNLADFATFVADWLNCGLYPQTDCQ